jgi:hypothetical protein
MECWVGGWRSGLRQAPASRLEAKAGGQMTEDRRQFRIWDLPFGIPLRGSARGGIPQGKDCGFKSKEKGGGYCSQSQKPSFSGVGVAGQL